MTIRCLIDPKRFTRGLVPIAPQPLGANWTLHSATINPSERTLVRASKKMRRAKRAKYEVDV